MKFSDFSGSALAFSADSCTLAPYEQADGCCFSTSIGLNKTQSRMVLERSDREINRRESLSVSRPGERRIHRLLLMIRSSGPVRTATRVDGKRNGFGTFLLVQNNAPKLVFCD